MGSERLSLPWARRHEIHRIIGSRKQKESDLTAVSPGNVAVLGIEVFAPGKGEEPTIVQILTLSR